MLTARIWPNSVRFDKFAGPRAPPGRARAPGHCVVPWRGVQSRGTGPCLRQECQVFLPLPSSQAIHGERTGALKFDLRAHLEQNPSHMKRIWSAAAMARPGTSRVDKRSQLEPDNCCGTFRHSAIRAVAAGEGAVLSAPGTGTPVPSRVNKPCRLDGDGSSTLRCHVSCRWP
jgi:hypothetical protein